MLDHNEIHNIVGILLNDMSRNMWQNLYSSDFSSKFRRNCFLWQNSKPIFQASVSIELLLDFMSS